MKKERIERLQKAGRKKVEHREKTLQRKLMEKWLRLPEREKAKYREEEERKRRIELKEVKENLHKWRSKDREEILRKKDRNKEKPTTEQRIEEIDEILE